MRQRDHERDLAEELEAHRAMRQMSLEASGLSRDAATAASRRALGNVTLAREDARGVWVVPWLESIWQDVGHGLRTLRTAPGFSLLAILTLALGIGANTAIFSIVNAVVLRPLPYANPDRLAMLWTDDAKRDLHEEVTASIVVDDWRRESQSFAAMAIFAANQGVLTGSGEPERILSAFASSNLFPVLGVGPAIGRTFSLDDEARGDRVAVLSHGFWQRRFGGSADAIGKTLTVDGDMNASKRGPRTIRVIGVMPAGFYFPNKQTMFWEPNTVYWRWANESTDRFSGSSRRWGVVGRLGPDVSPGQAQAEMTRIGERMTSTYPSTDPEFAGFGVRVVPLLDQVTGKTLQLALWILLGAVTLVLLIACANVANLVLARGATRQREFAIRAALGAGRARLVRQLLIESALLAAIGGACGFWLASVSLDALAGAALPDLPRFDEITIDRQVLWFTVALSMIAGVLFGSTPAWRMSRTYPNESLKDGSGASSGVRLQRTRGVLVMAQCALAVMLLAGSGLLLRSFLRVQSISPGFNPENVLLLRVSLAPGIKPAFTPPRDTGASMHSLREDLYARIGERIAGVAGVRSVGAITNLLNRGAADDTITIEGRPEGQDNGQLASADVSPTFFQTIGVPLIRGRFFTRDDAKMKVCLFFLDSCGLPRNVPPERELAEAAIVNQSFVRRFFAGADPLGKRFYIGPLKRKHYFYQIVGVVADMRRQGLEAESVPEWFSQLTPITADVVVRVDGDPIAMAGTIRDVVRSVDPHVMILNVSSVEQRMNELTASRRLQTLLLALFAGLAVSLAAIGIYGIVRYAVAQRSREIGVRIALGASPRDVLRLVLGEGLKLPLVGMAVGLAGALALTRVMANLLFGIEPTDPPTFAAVAVLLGTVAAAACYLPARKATKVDPVVALRCE